MLNRESGNPGLLQNESMCSNYPDSFTMGTTILTLIFSCIKVSLCPD